MVVTSSCAAVRDDDAPGPPSPPKAVLFAITATGIMANTLINPSLPEIVEGVGASRGAEGLVLGAGTLPGIVLAPVIGIMADAYGRRRVILPCLVLFGVAGLVGGLAPSLWVLLAARLAQGVGSAGLINLVVVLIGDHHAGAERSRVIGQNSAVLTTCLALYPPIGGALTDVFSFRAAFVPYLLAGGTAVVAARYLPVEQTDGHVDLFRRLRAAWPTLSSRPVTGILLSGTLLFALLFGLLLTALPIYLDDAFGLSAGQRGLALSAASVFNTITALNAGRLAGRLGMRGRVAVGTAVFAVGLLIVALAPTLWIMSPAVVLLGTGEGLFLPALQDASASAGPTATRGTVVAVFVAVSRLGQTVGPVSVSSALGPLGPQTVFLAGVGVAAALVAGTWPLLRGEAPEPHM